MVKHSHIGASSAHRWFNCPGSVRLATLAPPQESNVYAERGTAAHWALEKCLGEYHDPYSFEGEVCPDNDVELNREDVEAVALAKSMVDEIMEQGGTLSLETSLDLHDVYPGLFGTADVVIVNDDTLTVIDYKHGSGVPVNVSFEQGGKVWGNTQLMYYALGAYHSIADVYRQKLKNFKIAVIQPRCRHVDGPYREWNFELDELLAFQTLLHDKAKATEEPFAKICPGGHCRWCPAIAICPGMESYINEQAQIDFKSLTPNKELVLPNQDAMKPAELAKIMEFAPVIKDWLAQVEIHAKRLLDQGTEVPGYKLVKKRSNRKWREESVAVEFLEELLGEEAYEKKLLSPAKAEKKLSKPQKGLLNEIVHKPDTGTTMAPEYDKRQAVSGSAQTDFTAIKGDK